MKVCIVLGKKDDKRTKIFPCPQKWVWIRIIQQLPCLNDSDVVSQGMRVNN